MKAISKVDCVQCTEGVWKLASCCLLHYRCSPARGAKVISYTRVCILKLSLECAPDLQVPALLLRNLWRGNPWQKVDLCTGKLVELGGD